MPVELFYSDRYLYTAIESDTTNKAQAVHATLIAEPIEGVVVRSPQFCLVPEMVERVHSPEYVRAIFGGIPRAMADRNGVCRWTPAFADSRYAATSGVVEGAISAWESGGIAGSMSSGLHHARWDHGSGYCTLNGLVIAAEELLHRGAKRILVVDFDAHGGGGTASLIQRRPQIEQIDVSVNAFDGYTSTSNAHYWLTSSRRYLSTVSAALDSVVDPESVDLVLYNAGVDPHEDCLTGGVSGVTMAMLQMRDEMVFAWAQERSLPTCFVFAGGYIGGRLDAAKLVEMHRNTIRAATGVRSVGVEFTTAVD